MKITLLVDNKQAEPLQCEFGLSLLLEHSQDCWLFDTGADRALKHNLQILNIAPEKPRKIILSHGHYDHTGGLAQLPPAEIWCCKNITDNHFSFHSANDIHNIAMPDAAQKVLNASKLHIVEKFTSIAPGIRLTGPIPRSSSEDCGGKFFHDIQCTVPDTVDEEQALLTDSGALITGCCHAGIINTVQYCRSVCPKIPIRSITGGLHLRAASEKRLTETAEFLQRIRIEKLYLLHCTGDNAVAFLRRTLRDVEIYTPLPGESWEV